MTEERLNRFLLFSAIIHLAIFVSFRPPAGSTPAGGSPAVLSIDLVGPTLSALTGPLFPPGKDEPPPDSDPTTRAVEKIPEPAEPGHATEFLKGPEDCMLKMVKEICPDGSLGCIENYVAFCARARTFRQSGPR